MEISFLKGEPALLIKEGRFIAVGDLHIGKEFKLEESGMHFIKAAKRNAERLLELYNMHNAKGVILLGDVKESIMYPTKEEYKALREFFQVLEGIKIRIAKGNHDAHLDELMERMGLEIRVEREILLGKTALMHGNRMPSEEAMGRDYLIMAHGHTAVKNGGDAEKAWLIAKVGKRARLEYPLHNRKIRLIIVPAFSNLIVGTGLKEGYQKFIPALNNNVFDFNTAKVYGLDGELIGNARHIISINP